MSRHSWRSASGLSASAPPPPPPPPHDGAQPPATAALSSGEAPPPPQPLRAGITDPDRLRRMAEIDALVATPGLPLEVLDAVKAMLAAAKAALAATADSRALSDLERLELHERARRVAAAPFDRRAAQIGALQKKFAEDYALKDTPSQYELTMLGTRPLHRPPPAREPAPAAGADGGPADEGARQAQTQAEDDADRRSAAKNSKRFHFEPGANGFARYKLAEHDRGQKLYGAGARMGGYFVQPDARYDFQHDAAKRHGLPQYDGPNWAWDPRAGRFQAPPAR